jgi:hypothetical protein
MTHTRGPPSVVQENGMFTLREQGGNMYVKKPITRIDTLRMAVTLGHPPVCDFCGGMFPVFMYASKRTSTGLDIQAWRWAACFPCTVAIEKKDKQKLLQRLVRRLAVLTTVADEDIVRAAAEQSLSEFYDYVVEEEDV